eukprot:gene3456-biopygen6715
MAPVPAPRWKAWSHRFPTRSLPVLRRSLRGRRRRPDLKAPQGVRPPPSAARRSAAARCRAPCAPQRAARGPSHRRSAAAWRAAMLAAQRARRAKRRNPSQYGVGEGRRAWSAGYVREAIDINERDICPFRSRAAVSPPPTMVVSAVPPGE